LVGVKVQYVEAVSVSSRSIKFLVEKFFFWQVESNGTEKQPLKPMSVEDCKALMIIKNTTSKVDGHYHVGYFGGRKNHTYPLTKPAAEARLQGLKKRFH